MVAWAVAMVLGAAVNPTVSVQVRDASEQKCPLKVQLSRSLADLGFSPSNQPDLVATVSFEGPVASLSIDRKGKRVLVRKLGRLSCSELVSTSALILDRFVTEVGWSGSISMNPAAGPTPEIPATAAFKSPDAVGDQDAGVALGSALSVPDPQPPLDAGQVSSPDTPRPGSLDAGGVTPLEIPQEMDPVQPAVAFSGDVGAGGAVSNAGLTPTFSLELALHRGPWRLSLLTEVPLLPSLTVDIQNRPAGTLKPIQVHGLVAVGLQKQWQRFRLTAQLAAGALGTQMVASGTFNRPQTVLNALPELGAAASAGLRGPWGLQLGVRFKALFPLGSNSFAVEGTSAVFRTSPFSLSLALDVGWSSD